MRAALLLLIVLVSVSGAVGCVTVKPQERATLADPSMVFDDGAHQRAQLDHALENREGAYGGSGVSGGGCGCN